MLFSLVALLASCANTTNLPYSSLARSEHLSLNYPGYILGFEKFTKKQTQVTDKAHGMLISFPKRFEDEKYRKYRHFYEKHIIGNPRPLFLTHIVSFNENSSGTQFVYNAFEGHPSSKGDGVTENETIKRLNEFSTDLSSRLAKGKYSHIMVMCMGWNNDQHESIYRFNRLMDMVAKARQPKNFRPFVIGVTWPSVWESRNNSFVLRKISHCASYPVKSNDADELGFSYLNWLVHNSIPSAQSKKRLPVVLIGHSFGARALSRAVYSREYLNSPSSQSEPIDMFIGLQPALSINRHIPDNYSMRGEAYSEVELNRTKIIYTGSYNDKSNGAAKIISRAKNIGGPYGLKIAKEIQDSDILDFTTINCKSPNLSMEAKPGIPLVVDVTCFVKGREKNLTGVGEFNYKKLTPHNDILDAEMGAFISSCLDQL